MNKLLASNYKIGVTKDIHTKHNYCLCIYCDHRPVYYGWICNNTISIYVDSSIYKYLNKSRNDIWTNIGNRKSIFNLTYKEELEIILRASKCLSDLERRLSYHEFFIFFNEMVDNYMFRIGYE